ncbi:hypothetical protein E2C06_26050 [Dankookia rubra]|uniref:Uncharacterized protein n=1 Tax=Dankookia rubra TaxID=1442381 RepID=A0A4R5QAU7_9PROT|nr:hypothetical protein [Dankookia rubra]TDH59688.1 hypothetical protein E2C06_26050 [Dankookia rubra]
MDGKVWIEDSGTYSIYRMDVASGEFVEYLRPRPTNIRRVFVTGGKPATFWAGSNHGASIVRLEPLD